MRLEKTLNHRMMMELSIIVTSYFVPNVFICFFAFFPESIENLWIMCVANICKSIIIILDYFNFDHLSSYSYHAS